MGEVYRAVDTRLHRTVAIKVLSGHLSTDPQRHVRFVREAQTISSLNHPNICSLFDIGLDGGIEFLVMEYLSGETLAARLARGMLPLDQVLRVAIEIADALETAHRNGVVHRDLKPGNIMISEGRTKLLDFGLAKPVFANTAGTPSDSCISLGGDPITVEGTTVGTPAYMAPEQLDGLDADAASDVFAFGAVLFEMLTGRPAFEGTSRARVVAAVLETSPQAVGQFRADTPAALERLVHKCLEKRPDDRWQTVQDLLSELKWIASTSATDGRANTRRFGRRVRRASGVGAGVSGALLLAVIGLWAVRPPTYDSIAILPLQNAGGDPEMQYLSDGITEGVIRALSPLPDLRVMSGASVLRYRERQVDPQDVARTLNVSTLLVGKMSQRAGILTIDLEVIDGRDSRQIWAQHYTRPTSDVFGIEETIAREVSERLRVRLSGATVTSASSAKRFTADTEAYELYLRGRYHWNKRLPRDLLTSITFFKQAIDKDADYALAYAGLADAYALLGSVGYDVQSPSDVIPKARAAAERAVALDDQLAESHAALGFVLRFEWNRSAAEHEHLRAVALDPNYVTARQWLASHYWTQGRFDEALVQLQRAQELDPLSPLISLNLGRHFYYARKYDLAVEHLQKAIALDPKGFLAGQLLALVYIQMGMHAAAIQELQRFPAPMGAFQGVRGYISAVTGDRAAALNVLADLETLSQTRYIPAYALATVYAGLGMKNEAFAYIDRAVAERSAYLDYLAVEPTLDGLRNDPRFSLLLRRVDLREVPQPRPTASALSLP
jgi:serine/threonine-protein kinase